MAKDDSMMPQETVTIARSDLESGLMFAHKQVADVRVDLLDFGAQILAVAEELVAKGVLDMRSIQERKKRLYEIELKRLEERALITRSSSLEDKYAQDSPDVPCEELVELCKARCCNLSFFLSNEDLAEGVARWDYERPYHILRKSEGSCFHLEDGHCSIYDKRPGVCRHYDCRTDERIWEDYEKRIPAPMEKIQPA